MLRARLLAPILRFRVGFAEVAEDEGQLAELSELLAAGTVEPVIDRTYPLSEVREAMTYVETEHARAKVVISVPVTRPQTLSGSVPSAGSTAGSSGAAWLVTGVAASGITRPSTNATRPPASATPVSTSQIGTVPRSSSHANVTGAIVLAMLHASWTSEK